MATTVITVEDAVKQALNDLPSGYGAAGAWLSDQALRDFIADRRITYGTWTLTRQGSSPWFTNDAIAPWQALHFDNQTTPFAAEGAETYDIYARGVKVYLKTGSRTSSSISVTGTLIDFNRTMADLFWTLYTRNTRQQNMSAGDLSIQPDSKTAALLAAHEFWKGVTTSAN